MDGLRIGVDGRRAAVPRHNTAPGFGAVAGHQPGSVCDYRDCVHFRLRGGTPAESTTQHLAYSNGPRIDFVVLRVWRGHFDGSEPGTVCGWRLVSGRMDCAWRNG